MESRAHGVLGGKIGKIKSSNVNPGWLAEQLLAVDIVGPEDVEEAKNISVPKPDRRRDLVETVMGNGGEGVFQKFVDILLNKPNLKWLGKELKGQQLTITQAIRIFPRGAHVRGKIRMACETNTSRSRKPAVFFPVRMRERTGKIRLLMHFNFVTKIYLLFSSLA